jgi:outer membrane lipoprotein carrier protein
MKGWKTFRRGGRFLLTAALMTSCLCVQQPAAPAQQSANGSRPDVHELAHRVDQHYNKLHSLKAGFTESYAGLGVHRSESGDLLLLKPGRMRWDYTSPLGKLFLLDGKFAWFYSQGDAQVQRIPEKQLDDLRSPLRFLLGHTELEKELTHIALTTAPDGQFTLTGQPKGQEKRIPRLALTVTPTGAITAIEIEEGDGAITRFTFSGEVPNAAIPPGAFHFTPPAGVPVIDTPPPV